MTSTLVPDRDSPPELPPYLSLLQALAWAQFGDPKIVREVGVRGRQALQEERWYKSYASRPRERWNILGDLRQAKLHGHRRWPGRIRLIDVKEWFSVDEVGDIPPENGEVVFAKEDLLRRYPPLAQLHKNDEKIARRSKPALPETVLKSAVTEHLNSPGRREDGVEKIRSALRQRFPDFEPPKRPTQRILEAERGKRSRGRRRNFPVDSGK